MGPPRERNATESEHGLWSGSAQDSGSSSVAEVLAGQGLLSLSCPCRAPTRVTPDAPGTPAFPYLDPAGDGYVFKLRNGMTGWTRWVRIDGKRSQDGGA